MRFSTPGTLFPDAGGRHAPPPTVKNMRKALLPLALLALTLFPAVAHADAGLVLSAPVPGALLRPFDGGTSPYSAGHRGVDLAADEGAEVRSAAVGKIYFNGEVAGRPSVSVDHGNGLRTTYTPVAGSLPEGTQVRAGEVIGHLAGPPHCDPAGDRKSVV